MENQGKLQPMNLEPQDMMMLWLENCKRGGGGGRGIGTPKNQRIFDIFYLYSFRLSDSLSDFIINK